MDEELEKKLITCIVDESKSLRECEQEFQIEYTRIKRVIEKLGYYFNKKTRQGENGTQDITQIKETKDHIEIEINNINQQIINILERIEKIEKKIEISNINGEEKLVLDLKKYYLQALRTIAEEPYCPPTSYRMNRKSADRMKDFCEKNKLKIGVVITAMIEFFLDNKNIIFF